MPEAWDKSRAMQLARACERLAEVYTDDAERYLREAAGWRILDLETKAWIAERRRRTS